MAYSKNLGCKRLNNETAIIEKLSKIEDKLSNIHYAIRHKIMG